MLCLKVFINSVSNLLQMSNILIYIEKINMLLLLLYSFACENLYLDDTETILGTQW